MKRTYQMPEMMSAEMAECILQGSPNPNGKVTINKTTTGIAAGSVETKEEVWDDWEE